MALEDPSRKQDRKDRAKILAQCVSDTVDFLNRRTPNSVSHHPAAGLLTANCYFLVSDAYKRRRGMQDSRTHSYKVAAFTVATIMALRPIRVNDTAVVVSIQVAFANQQCAIRAAQGLLGLDLELLDTDYVRRFYDAVLDRIELPCLSRHLSAFEQAIDLTREITFE
jgi:hypothetical protein